MQAGPITRTEHYLFAVLALVVGLYVIARAWYVPTVHDEAMTFFVYVQTGDFLPFLSHWDAGNHLLDTALAWMCYKVFGMHAWALRLPSIAAFVLYAWAAYGWGFRSKDILVRWCLWSTLLLFPFLLDFFSLFRGYGIGMAALSAALLCSTRWFHRRRRADLLGALLWMAVATYADLGLITLHSLLLVALIPSLISDGHQRRSWGRLLPFVLIGVVPMVFALYYGLALEARGALYYGAPDGLIAGTIGSLIEHLLGIEVAGVNGSIALLMMACILFAGWLFVSGGRDPRTWSIGLLAAMLAADVTGRIVLFHWRDTLYPDGRTALQWALMSVLLIALVVDDRAESRRRWAFGACGLLVLPLRTLLTLNVEHTTYWPEQAIPIAVHQRIHDLQAEAGRPLTLGLYHQQPACWAFGEQEQGRTPILAQVSAHPHQGTDLLLIDPWRTQAPSGFRHVMETAPERLQLYARDPSTTGPVLLDTLTASASTDAEFIELWKPGIAPLIGKTLRVDLSLSLVSNARPLLASIVCEMDLGKGDRHYELVPLQFAQGEWNGDTLRTTRCIPRVSAGTERLVIYLWNKDRQTIAHNTRIVAYATSPGSFAPSPIALPGQ